ncbi:50S ribosomal protein L10 [Hypsizygus marmoreus]|uniref:50S ribosomal protein L10 n=1 Tax=Hypsizygus marmoreus TaxID=39966 RepID=A0A369K3D9_HYPMA|nr:50S ribosomal protein L10 [Hypsizygus marmoreus]
MLPGCPGRCSSWLAVTKLRLPSSTQARSYAISVKPGKILPGKQLPRVFKDKKAFQYNWYTKILQCSTTAPLVFLHHTDFSAQRLIKLRRDILVAANKSAPPSLASPNPSAVPAKPPPQPTLTVIRTSIFGAALRDFPGVNLEDADKMIGSTTGNFAVLTLPSFDPPQLNAILRALERGVPPRPPKTPEQIQKELDEKNADPATPGRRVKRVRQTLVPDLKLVGALIDGRVFLPQGVKEVSNLPSLDTLRAQIVGLLSAPAAQIAGVLSQASGGKLARALEGLKKGLEEDAAGFSTDTPPTF